MLLFRVFIFSFIFLLAACNPLGIQKEIEDENVSEVEDNVPKDEEITVVNEPALPISLGQALRCDKLANFAINNPQALDVLNEDQARTIQLRSRSAAYAKGEEQKLTPRENDSQRNAVYLGYESAGNFRVLGPPLTQAEIDESQRKTDAKVAKVLPKLRAELIEICKPMFLN